MRRFFSWQAGLGIVLVLLSSIVHFIRYLIFRDAQESFISEWLDYMKHLMNDYPYLFSLAMRTNPFDTNASVEVK